MVDDDAWPPEQPTSFTPLLLIHYRGHRTPEQVTAMAELTYNGDINYVAPVTDDQPAVKRIKLDNHERVKKVLNTSKATKEINDILDPLEKGKESSLVLIEGAPGIGKTVLLKEIAYRWGKEQLLQNYELLLLVNLRDPSLQETNSIDDLLQLFSKGDKNAAEIANSCAEYLLANGGKRVIFLLDGYDEYPRNLLENSLIASILKRQVLPYCGLIVSSRPHASEHLHKQATIRVDILGFTETEREDYIKQAFPDQPHKIEELTQYLYQQPSADSICFIPFNMVILLYLYKLGFPLPKNATELYRHFICSTICRHLLKLKNPFSNAITNLSNLPEPYNRIINQLSKFSLQALNSNKLIFTLDEITAACPDITAIPGAINGFGLLQAVQHFGLYTKTMTLNFIHFTVQEFLAAYYISHLPPDEELEVIKEYFWSDIHFNTFCIYTSLTKGQRVSFKKFLSGGNKAITISHEFLTNQLKCIRLYRCFKEADDQSMCKTIEHADIFKENEIDLEDVKLTYSDMESISLLLTSSFNKKWVMLNLSFCYIQDKGINILYRGLRHSSEVTITTLWLWGNGLTSLSSSLIGELIVKCKIKVLIINDNDTVGEGQQLYSTMNDPCNVLEKLYISYSELSSKAATVLFKTLGDNNRLKELYINGNGITDDVCPTIIATLKKNSCLVKLSIFGNPLSSEAILNIVQSLEDNYTLQIIGCPECSQSVREKVSSLQEAINRKRESQGNHVKLEIKYGYL